MTGVAVQTIGKDEILWFRKAFAAEWDGATMIPLARDRIYDEIGKDQIRCFESEVSCLKISDCLSGNPN